jgi:mannose-6-phosphate isomerase
LIKQYGYADVGIIFTLLMNVVTLNKGEWFVIPPNIPHAYIKGELCECMNNSDNVVRGGLTPKLKDVKTLLEILPFD